MTTTTALTTYTPGMFALAPDDADSLREYVQNEGPMKLGDLVTVGMPTQGNLFWNVDGEPQKTITGVIVYGRNNRAYWPGAFEGSGVPTDCSSDDGIVGYARIEDEIPVLWADTDGRHDCQSCPFAQFGTAPNGRGQACNLYKQLVVVTADRLRPIVVRLSATSIEPFRRYTQRLLDQRLRLSGVVTELALESASSGKYTYSRAAPTLVSVLSDADKADIRARVGEFLSSLMA